MRKTNLLRKFWYGLSSRQRYFLRRVFFYPIDFFDKISGKRHKYVPPRGLIYTGSAVNAQLYLNQGNFQVELLKNHINLLADDHVLDIGSGVGRTAIALTNYLNNKGRYHGFDVVKKGVDWCNNGIGKDYPNFNFKYVPLFNDLYNESSLRATNFKFPYEPNTFDKVFSFSLFTHMQKSETQNYFVEIKKVLKPGGLCLSTFFLYNDFDEELISRREDFNFPFKRNGYRLMNEKVKAGNVAFHKDKIKEMLESANLECVEMIDGYWRDGVVNDYQKEYQDIVIFKKKN